MISVKLLFNFIEITLWHVCSPVNLLCTPFNNNTSRGLFLCFIRKTAIQTFVFKPSCLSSSVIWFNKSFLFLAKFFSSNPPLLKKSGNYRINSGTSCSEDTNFCWSSSRCCDTKHVHISSSIRFWKVLLSHHKNQRFFPFQNLSET